MKNWKRVLEVLVEMMKRAEIMTGTLDGKQKKKFVMSALNSMFNMSQDEEDLLFYLIDLVIELDKNKLKIKEKLIGCCG